MKKFIFIIAVILSLTLAGCSNKKPEVNSDSNSTDNIISLEEGIWPENEYTDELPVPPGTVNHALLLTSRLFEMVKLSA